MDDTMIQKEASFDEKCTELKANDQQLHDDMMMIKQFTGSANLDFDKCFSALKEKGRDGAMNDILDKPHEYEVKELNAGAHCLLDKKM